ncbi:MULTISPECIES: type VII toxin-antitoxin system HepT family RNase toxin [Dictyoglomus]|jgi:uncharacterized protein YutE (UPF0331/DUF86 family)|uniref:DUF86 domain-containing protein n=1 Tax=Dictyoglomus turgidum (strain DSM 6724 / Z-1310) TaxID=515635 RepID=B8DZA3_DICTD|nr:MULTISPECIES: DUF86 domain-containing protein [Dictyoglomus]ACK41836.1 protein of unknown function DUF86 [Dictyoglomus turgidum DSM 6724]HBU31309.1 DUF86 domain-containing protein [Dictyoglomus sp.]
MIIPLNKEVILSRIREIEKGKEKLLRFKDYSLEEFKSGENFAIAEHYLRRALEAVFDIGNHILSRIPGIRVSTYKDIALKLGEYGIIPGKFAKEVLVKMAGYRNRLVHFYAEVSIEELYYIIQNNLNDFDEYLKYIKDLLENPEKFGLTLE